MSDFIEEFLLSQGGEKIRLSQILEAWNSEENQALFQRLILTSITPRAKTAYKLFMEANKEKGFQKAKAHWLILSDEEREPWLEKGKEEKEKYIRVVGKPIRLGGGRLGKKKIPKVKTKEEKEVDKIVEKSFLSTSTSSSESSKDNPMLDFIAKERQNLAKKHPDWDMRRIVASLKAQWEKEYRF